ncbi:MAG: recombinase zinc beta ribbon domain-containing protein [Rubrobacter sp.]|nr:recombinase zinc beta ribbon domain-containing protein [Rubrobacter sp.]
MATSNRRSRPRDSRIYHYYRCSKHQREGAHSCHMLVNYRAERIEAEVWSTSLNLWYARRRSSLSWTASLRKSGPAYGLTRKERISGC